jgi:hypothetical protein
MGQMPVTIETRQRAGCGQGFEVMAHEPGAITQLLHAAEGTCTTRRNDTLAGSGTE